jgi:prepilin-type N-terminal cleavage/methylation domain-containing protein
MIPCGNRQRGLSLTELLVALAVALIFLGSVVTAFVQISRAAAHAEAQVSAHTRARTAIDAVLRDVARIRTDPTIAPQHFVLLSQSMPYGDNIDNDGDGSRHEEIVDGRDTDGNWNAAKDNHARIGRFWERQDFVGVADLGDFDVDEDIIFSRDTLAFRVPADPGSLRPPEHITFRVGTFDGQDHVLLREVVTNPGQPNEQTRVEPIVFDVVSFDVLAFNPNDDVSSLVIPARPYWQATWNAATVSFPNATPIGAPFGTPPFHFPAAVYVRVTVNAEGAGLENFHDWPLGGRPLRTVTLSGVATIGEVIKSPVYRDYVRRPQ